MHDIDITQDTPTREQDDFEAAYADADPQGMELGEAELDGGPGGPLSEEEEEELAADLLEVGTEEELDYFLGGLLSIGAQLLPGIIQGIGGLFRRGHRRRRRRGRGISPARGSAVQGELKDIVRAALPFVGSAVGSAVPGLGTVVGGALGTALSSLFEVDMESLAPDDQEFEKARRFVRLATQAARQAAAIPPQVDAPAAARAAVKAAARALAPKEPGAAATAAAELPEAAGQSGQWRRRGNKIVLYGV